MKLRVDNGAILAYRRLPYKAWYAIAEFVDNAVDAYLRDGNREALDRAFADCGEHLTVEVTLDRAEGVLRVADNSMGMSESELDAAMVIGVPPRSSAGLSEFGMGMKTAAVWFADEFEIRTKKLGEDHEVRVRFDVESFVRGESELAVARTPKDRALHYTVIELRGLKRSLGVSALGKTRAFLGSIYRQYLREGTIDLLVNQEQVTAPTSRGDSERFLLRTDGSPFVVEVGPLTVNDKQVSGWIGILRPGSGFTGRNQAGFALIRHKRAVRGWLDSWRPEEIFGDARNDKLNQRLTGEIFLDGPFKPSHIKDTIDWEGDEEEDLGKALLEICKTYNLLAEARKNIREDEPDPEEERERQEAVARLEAELTSKSVQDTITLLDVPSPDHARVATSVLLEAASGATPVLSFPVGEQMAHLYEVAISVNDPYFEYSVLDNRDLHIVLNTSHPAFRLLPGADARIAHYHHVVLDAAAEWRCRLQSEPFDPSSMRLMKDRLFRSVANYEEGS